MIRTLVVADSGRVMAAITRSLGDIPAVDIVAYANGRASLAPMVRATLPDVVLIDEMDRPGQALSRIAEVLGAAPGLPIVGLAARSDSTWVVAALRAGAGAVVPRDLHPPLLERVLLETLAQTQLGEAA
jgi:DNA-binding NarL/FixJ family response regulator